MAKITKEDVLRLARLSRLHLTDEEVSKYQVEIEAMLGYVEQLKSVDLGDLEPTSQVTGLKNVMRQDTEKSYGASPEQLLKNSTSIVEGQIKVRRMLQ
ncbi:MAG: Asp-tRNA(Asn)/Glu-tRNA(Gln) amidotransferase subunit GatC [Candidatus Saccharibacteria bacterium]|jgi:aspartyl-tRNA(Asn)/glutamyl-tRNA(Gln) amidotransferase subunit C